jgi:large subunit ribosomal protein L24
MQKVVRRAALARNQTQRKTKRLAEKDRHDEWKQSFLERTRFNRSLIDETKEERLNRRDDWMRGPLAPRRDAGQRMAAFGTVPTSRLNPPKIPVENRRKFINIVVGDRVCLMKGRDKGRIGKVKTVNAETECVEIEGLNIVSSYSPSKLSGIF